MQAVQEHETDERSDPRPSAATINTCRRSAGSFCSALFCLDPPTVSRESHGGPTPLISCPCPWGRDGWPRTTIRVEGRRCPHPEGLGQRTAQDVWGPLSRSGAGAEGTPRPSTTTVARAAIVATSSSTETTEVGVRPKPRTGSVITAPAARTPGHRDGGSARKAEGGHNYEYRPNDHQRHRRHHEQEGKEVAEAVAVSGARARGGHHGRRSTEGTEDREGRRDERSRRRRARGVTTAHRLSVGRGDRFAVLTQQTFGRSTRSWAGGRYPKAARR